KGVRCLKGTRDDFDVFWRLLSHTMDRGGFRTHPRSYYEKMLEIPFVDLWRAEWEGHVVAMGIWSSFAGTVTYLHGASASEYRNLMAPHLLHWTIMRSAKTRGEVAYDFWGVDVAGTHPSWAGFTRFKTGFGGAVVEYPGTFDLPISRFGYRLYQLARRIRRFG
ncbi:peptidoglycan bridge formation glycyltransferase FemA/FemB family protein, partial [Candidatus Uhrbacteria bacterium]|nr:peptidoglycan bridge formation glycyltransferase FemA/FemB family protein [Candidatus Uhrbacteria bacterium]